MGFAVILHVAAVLVTQQVAVFGEPQRVIEENLVGAPGCRIVVDAVIEEDARAGAVEQPLQGSRARARGVIHGAHVKHRDELFRGHGLIIGGFIAKSIIESRGRIWFGVTEYLQTQSGK